MMGDVVYQIEPGLDVDEFLDVLERSWGEAHPLAVVAGDSDVGCEGDTCAI